MAKGNGKRVAVHAIPTVQPRRPAKAITVTAAVIEVDRHQVGRPLPPADFARLIGYSIHTVTEWIETGEVETVRPPVKGARARVPWTVLEEFAAALKLTIRIR